MLLSIKSRRRSVSNTLFCCHMWSGCGLGYGQDGPGFHCRQRQKSIYSLFLPHRLCGVPRVLTQDFKRTGRESWPLTSK